MDPQETLYKYIIETIKSLQNQIKDLHDEILLIERKMHKRALNVSTDVKDFKRQIAYVEEQIKKLKQRQETVENELKDVLNMINKAKIQVDTLSWVGNFLLNFPKKAFSVVITVGGFLFFVLKYLGIL